MTCVAAAIHLHSVCVAVLQLLGLLRLRLSCEGTNSCCRTAALFLLNEQLLLLPGVHLLSLALGYGLYTEFWHVLCRADVDVTVVACLFVSVFRQGRCSDSYTYDELAVAASEYVALKTHRQVQEGVCSNTTIVTPALAGLQQKYTHTTQAI